MNIFHVLDALSLAIAIPVGILDALKKPFNKDIVVRDAIIILCFATLVVMDLKS